MSDLIQVEQRTCRFPGCERPAVAAEAGTGRPPEYCDDEGHNRAAAWRARRRLTAEPARSAQDEKRPVDAARQRASEIRGQVAGMVEHLGAQLNALVEELRTVADPDAAEAQIESVTSEAAEQVATASVRATRAEQAQRKVESERVEADAAAVEASELAEQQQVILSALGEQLAVQDQALEQATVELAETRSTGEARDRAVQAELSDLREHLATTHARLTETEQARAEASVRADAAVTARAEADERARGAGARAEVEADRAKRAEADLAMVREQLDQLRTERETLREQISALRGTASTVTVERNAARADADRERAHGDQRVADLRTSQDQQYEQLRAELAEARQDAREQRTRADTAEARTTTPPAAGKPASKR
jgi:colicin import membrane protein